MAAMWSQGGDEAGEDEGGDEAGEWCQPCNEGEEEAGPPTANQLFSFIKGMKGKGGGKGFGGKGGGGKNGGGKNGGGKFGGNCNYCGKYGHRVADCWKKDQDMGKGKDGAKGNGFQGLGKALAGMGGGAKGKGKGMFGNCKSGGKGNWGGKGVYGFEGYDGYQQQGQGGNGAWTLCHLSETKMEKPPGLESPKFPTKILNSWKALEEDEKEQRNLDLMEMEKRYDEEFPGTKMGNYSKGKVARKMEAVVKKKMVRFEEKHTAKVPKVLPLHLSIQNKLDRSFIRAWRMGMEQRR